MKKPPETFSDGFFQNGVAARLTHSFLWADYQMITRSSSGMNISPSVIPKAS